MLIACRTFTGHLTSAQ